MTYSVILQFLLSWVILSVVSSVPVLSPTAGQHIKAAFKTVKRRGEIKTDFTKMEVTAKPLKMVENPQDIDTNRVSLEIKAGSGNWMVVSTLPQIRGGVYKWMVLL